MEAPSIRISKEFIKELMRNAKTQKKSILAAEVESVLRFYPLRLGIEDKPRRFDENRGLVVSIKSKSGQSVSEAFSAQFPAHAGDIIPSLIDSAISNYRSFSDFVSDDFAKVSEDNPFDRIPLAELDSLKPGFYPTNVEAYARRRTLWFLLTVCCQNPQAFFKKELFLALFKNGDAENFLHAIRIEPCFLQTKLGIQCLKEFSFWNREQTYDFSNALQPARERKSGKISSDRHRVVLTKALLVLRALIPDIAQMKDGELLAVFHSLGYVNKSFDEENFRKLRHKVIQKR